MSRKTVLGWDQAISLCFNPLASHWLLPGKNWLPHSWQSSLCLLPPGLCLSDSFLWDVLPCRSPRATSSRRLVPLISGGVGCSSCMFTWHFPLPSPAFMKSGSCHFPSASHPGALIWERWTQTPDTAFPSSLPPPLLPFFLGVAVGQALS